MHQDPWLKILLSHLKAILSLLSALNTSMLPAIYKSSLYHPLLLSQPGTERHPINKAGHSGLPNTPFYWELAKHAGKELAGQAIQATRANNARCFSSSSSHGSWHPERSEEG